MKRRSVFFGLVLVIAASVGSIIAGAASRPACALPQDENANGQADYAKETGKVGARPVSVSEKEKARGDKPVDVVIGESQFFNADHIKIQSVTSSERGFEIGATVTVKGTYTLNSVETADLCLFSTTTLKPGEEPKSTPVQDGQRIKAQRGKHKFSLSKVITEDGNPHLTFYHLKTGKPFGGVYFGDKSNVLMKKNWSYEVP